MPGEAWQRRMDAFGRSCASFEAITDESASKALGEAGYRFPKDGLVVVREAIRIHHFRTHPRAPL